MTSATSTPRRPHSDSELPHHGGQTISISAENMIVPASPSSPSPPHNVGQTTPEKNTPSVISPSSRSHVDNVLPIPHQASTSRGSSSASHSEQANSISSENGPRPLTSAVSSPSSLSRRIISPVSPRRQRLRLEHGTRNDVLPPSPPHITFDIPPRPTPRYLKVVINDVSSFDVDFKPIVPKYISRYNRNSLEVVNSTLECFEIPALMRGFPNESLPWLNDLPGWQSCTHPNGVPYLYNETLRTFTEARGITSPRKFRLVNECMNALRRPPMCPRSVDLDDNDIELVLQLEAEPSDGPVVCKYYFVDHANRTLFWLHKYVKATDQVFDGMRGVHDPSHIAHALEYQYWLHCDTYPNHKHDQLTLLDELRNVVSFARADMILSEKSLSPYSTDDLSNILKLIDHLKVNAKKDSPHCICVIARFMKSFSHSKFLNFHGQPYARLDVDTSVFKEDTHPSPPLTILLLILDTMFFWAQQTHYNQLQRVWVDKTIIHRRWKDFSSNLVAEWMGITIYSTVMLVVDVTFLAVPNMNIQQSHSVGVISIYVSIISITGSLIVSLLLARHIQSYGLDSFYAVAKLTRTKFRMRALAMIYSLPYAMLLWGMIFFSIAFLYNVFKSTTIAMLASVVSGCTFVVIFILLFFWTASGVRIFSRLARLVGCSKRRAKLIKDAEFGAGIPVADSNTQPEVHYGKLADSSEKLEQFFRYPSNTARASSRSPV